ncbi:MAG TPA: winged helix-turn-helix domain-containing protein [Rhizomicrobium sp.]|jgi:DNA-binding transcriptional ArsR family regulator|nr:winged helix-turn-helix domain-containing protein [Rhizomicrobium sp.]HVZ90322.1 winged helix-turn-helix domain-containing protein [Rhizomicrobium sp.]
MKPPDQSTAYRIRAGKQAAAIDHPVRSRLLMACARRERSLTELARDLGQPLSKLHYHLALLKGSGLVRVSRVQRRSGRPIRYYRAIAGSFLVSLADVPEPAGEKWSRELRESLTRQANRGEMSLFFHFDEAGQMKVRLIDSSGRGRSSRAFDYWKVLSLTAEQRISLSADLAEVIARYEQAQDRDRGEMFLVHAAFAPKL